MKWFLIQFLLLSASLTAQAETSAGWRFSPFVSEMRWEETSDAYLTRQDGWGFSVLRVNSDWNYGLELARSFLQTGNSSLSVKTTNWQVRGVFQKEFLAWQGGIHKLAVLGTAGLGLRQDHIETRVLGTVDKSQGNYGFLSYIGGQGLWTLPMTEIQNFFVAAEGRIYMQEGVSPVVTPGALLSLGVGW